MRGDPTRTTALARSASIALLLLAVQFAAIRFAPASIIVRIALPATIAFAPAALWPHRRYLGAWIIFVGLAANFAPVVANGGLMPIRQSTVAEARGDDVAAAYASGAWIEGSKDVLVAPGDGRLTALGDQIIVRAGSGGMAASAGDVVILSGALVLAAQAALSWASGRSRATPEEEGPIELLPAA